MRDEELEMRDKGGGVRVERGEMLCAGERCCVRVRDLVEGVRDEGGKVSDEEGEVREQY